MTEIIIESKKIGRHYPTYFIADIAANHDGDLSRAIDLIHLAAESGADAAKFQHFAAETIVSDYGFKALGNQHSHQAKWKKSVFKVYQDASLNPDWTPILSEECKKAGIIFFTSPYSFALVDVVDPYVPAYKIGSGDITWIEIIQYMAKKDKPVLLATGASTMDEVCLAVDAILEINRNLVLMQCNTNYTASLDNFRYIQLNVLKTYNAIFPDLILGLSDHTPGHTTILGAVALGARVIEKHFTDDTKRDGPDHGFSMDPKTWKEMVQRTRELEAALGSGVKRIEENEAQTVILQRRAIRARERIKKGSMLTKELLVPLRPCPVDALPPYRLPEIIGKKVVRTIEPGEHLRWNDLN
jgi:N-acetylneuraminate synthase